MEPHLHAASLGGSKNESRNPSIHFLEKPMNCKHKTFGALLNK